MIFDRSLVAGSNDPEYLNNLIKMNNMDEKLVMHYAALLMNPYFIKSQYYRFTHSKGFLLALISASLIVITFTVLSCGT